MDSIKIKPLNKADFEHWENRTTRPETADYWIKRAFRAEEAADKTTEELLRDMKKVYQNSLAEIEKEIQAFYGRYAEENGLTMQEVHRRLDPKQLKSAREEIRRYYEFADPKKIGKNMSDEYRDELRRLSARAYMSRLEEIKARLKYQVVKLAAEENKAFDRAMKEAYTEAHAQASYTIDRGLGFSEGYAAPDEDTLDKVVRAKWLDRNYSDSIWEDKGRLLTSIENELLTGIARGQNPRKIAEAMATKYGQDYRNCERLARTETIHYMNEATYDSYKEHGVEKYQFVCGLDERTCPTCGALDGTVHDVRYKEEGVNYPVMHPNCYDDKTEVLTREGWKLFRECSDDDEYSSMNPDNPGETDYLKASACISDKTLMILEFRYGRKLVRVTENHDMLVKYGGKLHFMKAKNLLSLSSNAIGRDIFILDDRLEEIPLSDFSCTLEQGWFSVYCVELPKWHTLLVRRDGSTPVWCGNCRCTTVPYFEKDDIDAMFEEATRAAYDEDHKIYDVPESMTYKQWLETIGSDQQKAILGKERYEMHVNGTPISDFWKDGRLRSMSELRKNGLIQSSATGGYHSFTKGIPMTPENAILDVNPSKDKYNCQACSVVYEARLRGLNVYAVSSNNNEYIKMLSKNMSLAWLDKEGKHPIPQRLTSDKESFEITLGRYVKEGERYLLGFRWLDYDAIGGHIVNVYKKNGDIVFVDSQKCCIYGKDLYDCILFGKYVDKKYAPELLRVNDMDIDMKFAENIMKKYKK